MINLIKNEFVKVFKKKTIYILLIITLGYILLSNFIMKYNNSDYSYYYYYVDSLEYYKSEIKNLDPNNPADLSTYIQFENNIRLLELTEKYGNNSWQAYVINNILSSSINTMIMYEYSDEITEDAYAKAKQTYDNALEKLDNDDWKYFVEQDLKSINESIEEQNILKSNTKDKQTLASIDNTIFDLNLKKQIDEWRLEKNISYAPSFLNNALDSYYNNALSLHDYENTNIEELSSDELQYYNNSLENANLNKYYIENNITLKNDNRSVLINFFSSYELFILIIGIVIAASIVSEEFNRGTIKLLLVKPYNRIKILMAKFIVCVLILILAIIFIVISQLILGGLIQGFDSLSIPAIIYNFDTNTVQTMNVIAYVALIGICKFPIYLLLTTLAFTCSTIFTNTALAVAVPFLGYMVSSLINQFALAYNIKQIIYFVTPNWDLSYYLFGGTPLFKNLTAPFSIIVCLIYLIIMVITSIIVFKKRDIKNI